ncbi:MAG: hypothetical protein JRJ51_17900 [Deltaproteobacteria bacterium]|nr:hypothetical protein [Deltaproteobacteria bacterium]
MEGKRSHPVVIGRSLFPDLHKMRGDTGARNLFLKYPDQICLVAPKGEYRDIDVDTPADYQELLETLDRD